MNMGIHRKRQGCRQIFPLRIIEQGKRGLQQTGLAFLPEIILAGWYIRSRTHQFPLKPCYYVSFYKHHFLKWKEIFDYPQNR